MIGIFTRLFVVFADWIDPLGKRFAIGINHWSIGAEASQAIFLNMAMLLAEMANNSFRFIIVSVEGVEVGLEWQLPLSDADRVDGF